MELADLLKRLHALAKSGIETYVTYDFVQELPPEQFAQLKRLEILVETQPAKYYTCDECVDEDCSGISLLPFKDRQTGQTVGLFSCCKEGGEGLKKVDLNRLRQWDILPDKIEAYLGTLTEQIPTATPSIAGADHSGQENIDPKGQDAIADWDRSEDKTRVCNWIQKTWIKRGKPKKAAVIRAALQHFGFPQDYYNRVRKEYNHRFE